jgi:hypothetical protein
MFTKRACVYLPKYEKLKKTNIFMHINKFMAGYFDT